MSRITCVRNRRRAHRRSTWNAASNCSGVMMRWPTTMTRRSAAVRSVFAHRAAFSAATSGRTRRTPPSMTGGMVRYCRRRTPLTRWVRFLVGTAMSITSWVKPSKPLAWRAATPSSAAPAPASQMAWNHAARRDHDSRATTTTVCLPRATQRPASTSPRTASRLTPTALRSRRCATPPWGSATALARVVRSARGSLRRSEVIAPASKSRQRPARPGFPDVNDTPHHRPDCGYRSMVMAMLNVMSDACLSTQVA